jgi:multiple sugar transport system ATP-binding protein
MARRSKCHSCSQIVTVTTANGQIKARLPSGTVGLALRPDKLSLFDVISGRALPSALYAGDRDG